MRKNIGKRCNVFGISVIMAATLLTGCGRYNDAAPSAGSAADRASADSSVIAENREEVFPADTDGDVNGEASVEDSAQAAAENTTGAETAGAEELTVSFGDDGDAFTMHLYENDTAHAVAGHVGTEDWRLPVYNFDNYEGWEYFQYYDIPDRYEIPSNSETITSARAGEVYYSEPNRIILFYKDAEISGEYTPIGYFEPTEAFVEAVEENPVLEGWGNKIVRISAGD